MFLTIIILDLSSLDYLVSAELISGDDTFRCSLGLSLLFGSIEMSMSIGTGLLACLALMRMGQSAATDAWRVIRAELLLLLLLVIKFTFLVSSTWHLLTARR